MDIFISYSSKDIDFAKKLCAILRNKEYSYWIAHENECFGEHYAATIMGEIDKSNIVIILASKNSCESIHVINEINAAVMRHKKLLPIIIDDTPLSPAMEYYLSSHHYLYATSDGFYDHFVNRLNTLLGQSVSESTQPTASPDTKTVNSVDKANEPINQPLNNPPQQTPYPPQQAPYNLQPQPGYNNPQQTPYNPQPQQGYYSPQQVPQSPQPQQQVFYTPQPQQVSYPPNPQQPTNTKNSFFGKRAAKEAYFQDAKANMLALRKVVQLTMLDPSAKQYKVDLNRLEEKLHFSNDSVITAQDETIYGLLVELQNNIANPNFDVKAAIAQINYTIDTRNVLAKR